MTALKHWAGVEAAITGSGESDRLLLQVHAGPARGGDGEVAPERRPERHVRRGDLVLGLHGSHAEALVARELVEELGSGRDRVAGEKQRQPAADARRDQAERRCGRPVDAPIRAGLGRRGLHLVVDMQQLGGLAEVVTRAEGSQVGAQDGLFLAELLLDPLGRDVRGAAVHPRDQPQREEVLGAGRVAGGDSVDPLGRPDRHRGHRNPKQPVVVQGAVLERVGLVPGLAQVVLSEPVLVGDHDAPALELGEVHLQGRRIHDDEHVRLAAGGEDVARGEVDLKRRDARERSGGGADLSREVGQRDEVVADQRRGSREPVAGELYPIARIPGEPDDDSLFLFYRYCLCHAL
jgi:hypothetical protein